VTVWYASKGRHEDAKKALRRLVGNVEGYDIEHEYLVIRNEVEQSMATANEQSENGWSVLFKSRVNLKRMVIATLPFTYQNFVGVPLIFGYTTYFFSLAKMEDPFLGSMIVQIILLVGILSSFYWVDKVGRRVLVIGGGVLMGALVFLVGGLAYLPPSTGNGIGLITLCGVSILRSNNEGFGRLTWSRSGHSFTQTHWPP
jgi:MFS transporter, SP family, general alpha glucoside:H+ symporter